MTYCLAIFVVLWVALVDPFSKNRKLITSFAQNELNVAVAQIPRVKKIHVKYIGYSFDSVLVREEEWQKEKRTCSEPRSQTVAWIHLLRSFFLPHCRRPRSSRRKLSLTFYLIIFFLKWPLEVPWLTYWRWQWPCRKGGEGEGKGNWKKIII